MAKFNRFILPLAIAKIILVFLVLHFFFSSCSQDSILYSDGPVVEIEASFGVEDVSDVGDTILDDVKDVFDVGDTIYLEIALESPSVMDQVTGSAVVLHNAELHTAFAFVNAEDEYVFPTSVVESGQIDSISSSLYNASFGNVTPTDELISAGRLPRLKVGFVFDKVGDYTFYFVNTPNSNREGSVDIFYDRNPDNAQAVRVAYAIYLFDLTEITHNYIDDKDTPFRNKILQCAGSDQSIVDFKIIKRN